MIIASMRVPMQRVKPPRALVRASPRGQTVGAPGDREGQGAGVWAALGLLESAADSPTLVVEPAAP